MSYTFSPLISVVVENNEIKTLRSNEEKSTKQLHGTTNANIKNMLIGVSSGYKKEIEIKGVGYKATLKGNTIEIIAGYSHAVNLEVPSNLKLNYQNQPILLFQELTNKLLVNLLQIFVM